MPTNQELMPINKETSNDAVADTPLFKQLLAYAAEIVLNRFKVLKLLSQAYKKLTDPAQGKAIRNEIFDKMLTLIRMTKAVFTLEYKKLPWLSLVRIVAALLYFVLIADLIPDFIPFLGFTDDALIIAWVYNAIESDLADFHEWETTFAMEWED